MKICAECNARIGLYSNKCKVCGSVRWLLTELRDRKTKEEIEKEEAHEKAIADIRSNELDKQIELLEENAKKPKTYLDWGNQSPEIQYRYYCKQIEERNRRNHEQREVKVFSFQTGYVSDTKDLIRYTKDGIIKWNYCPYASIYDLKKGEFCIVFVSSTYCILEIRGNGKNANRVYSGYIKLSKDKEFQLFEEWRSVYTKIKNTNKEWDAKVLLKSLKEKVPTGRETNWSKIVLVSAKDAKKTEEYFNYVPKDEIPMSYARFLNSRVYGEVWGTCGMSGGGFSPR